MIAVIHIGHPSDTPRDSFASLVTGDKRPRVSASGPRIRNNGPRGTRVRDNDREGAG